MLPLVYDALRYVWSACRIRVQPQSRALPIILLTAALDFAAASGANGQTITIGPDGTLEPPQLQGPPFYVPGSGAGTNNLSPGQTANVVGPVTIIGGNGISALGDVFRAPTTNITNPAILNIGGPGSTGPITITTGPPIGMPPTADSALVVNGGGQGAPTGVNSTNTGINVNVTGTSTAPVALTSSGHGVVWLWGSSASLTATGQTVPGSTTPVGVVFTGNGTPTNFSTATPPTNVFPGLSAQESTVVTVQNGATATLTDVILNLLGPDTPGFLPASKMALCVGGCGETGDPGGGGNNGGNATLNNVFIDVTSDNSAGIWVSRISNVKVMDGSITVGGANSQGVHADANGSMTLTDVPITMGGANSIGAFASTVRVANLSFGPGIPPATPTPTGQITINGGSITTTGPNSTGAMASGADANGRSATVILNGTSIENTATATDSNGLAVCTCSVSPPNTVANGGPQTVQVGGIIIATDATVTTTGTGSNGAFAQDMGSISLTDSTVRLTQLGGGGSAYFANNGTITATDTTALTVGPNSNGGMLSNGGNLTINGGSVTTTGAGSFGFLVTPVTPDPFVTGVNVGNPGVSGTNAGAPNTLTISGATVSSAADAFHVTDAIANIRVTGSTVTDNNGVLLSTQSSGATNMMVSGSQLSGAILTDMISNPLQSEGTLSTANVTLQNGTTWTMTGSSNLTNLTNSASNIIYSAPVGDPTQLSSYKTLTVMKNSMGEGGNYTGVGGMMTLNTYLGADSSPSDRLVINGGEGTGTTALTIENTTGPGAPTVANGILVVQAINGGETTPTAAANGAAAPGDAFSLANGEELRGGAFDYRLFRGGRVDSSDPGVENSWFLRNVFEPLPVEPEPPAPQPPSVVEPAEPGAPNEVFPSAPPTEPLDPGVLYPIIGPELATYGVVQPLARELGLSILGTLNDRVGDTYEPDVVAPTAAPEGPAVELPTKKEALPTKKPGPVLAPRPLFAPSVWGRFFGQTIDNRYGGFADPRASGNLGGFQGGVDLLRGSLIAGQFERMGLYGAYGNVNANVDGLVTNAESTGYVNTHTGSMSLNAWSGGAYWTHVGPGGWYLDTVLQGTSYSGSASTADARLNTDGWGFIASLEGGVPFALPQLGPGFVLEPQGQILWQKVSFHHDYDGLGDVALGDTTGPSGRIGLRGKWTIVTGDGEVWQPYLRANLWRDWGAEANTVYSGTDVVPLLSQITLLEVGGGLTGRINANVSVFANVDYEFAVGAANGERQNGVRGALGARYTW